MSRRIALLVLGLGLFTFSACASPKAKPAPRTSYSSVDEEEVERDEAPQRAADNAAESQNTEAAQAGPIDLGLGDGDDDAQPIVINRPNVDAADMEDPDAEESNQSHTYAQACDVVEDCAGLDAPECAGEMDCVDLQCVYTCDPDEAEDADDLDGAGQEDDFNP
ncbi:hypothetical protein [Bradymonas sediminis]|uniref:Uncharacterized protein n=1 Tax=Bradymonas sediminis TaxID=1548548 RepID=A0A2Z4FGS0_9DELT|nr:hypothetical protein [Bradymonas sediminis]AWV88139.1 hypothetical protein DN745_01830 [Bradymonas sediminis]TDP77262.1 hypothetical protein DFR33_101162 [Bradymonas sediminis]